VTVSTSTHADEGALRLARVRRLLVTTAQLAAAGSAGFLIDVALPDLPVWAAVAGLLTTLVVGRANARRHGRHGLVPAGMDALEVVRTDALRRGGGAFIGLDAERGGVVHAPAEAACLVLGRRGAARPLRWSCRRCCARRGRRW
jgi:hypothetical protein